MTVMLPSLALTLLCLLRAGAEVPVQPGFNAEKFAGTWHVTAAVANCSMFMKMKDGMKSSIATISFTVEGDLLMKLAWPMLDKCQKFELLFQRSGQAGHYVGMCGQGDQSQGHPETEGGHHQSLCPGSCGRWVWTLPPSLGERSCCRGVPGSARSHRGSLLISPLGKSGAQALSLGPRRGPRRCLDCATLSDWALFGVL
ncbi:lipocalin-15-like isoform X1 [Caloenas nicobarica]|uniref:lipocalin-15-like isoform X1 n=1 Tax=Caloenas nicobarica TaxID=187106 RepID=UPI0032B788F7